MNDKMSEVNKDIFKSVMYVTLGLIMLVVALIHIPNSNISIDNDWIGFYGSIVGSLVGGFITFIGIQLTLNHNEEQRKLNSLHELEKKRLEILPHITMESQILGYSHTITESGIDYDFYRTKIKFRNIGRDTCLNLNASLKIIGNSSPFDGIPTYFFVDSLIKGELSKGFDFLISKERMNYKQVLIEFYDLEHRLYEQEIQVSNIFHEPLNDSPISISTLITHSGFPKIKNSV